MLADLAHLARNHTNMLNCKCFETFKLSTTFLAEVVTLKIPKPEMVVSFFQFFLKCNAFLAA